MRKSTVVILGLSLLVLTSIGIHALKTNPSPVDSSGKPISGPTLELISAIRNEDVIWSGNYLGIMPTKLVGATLTLRDNHEDINRLLIDALLDQERFVAGHVLLTLRMGEAYNYSASEWNGLSVQLNANGKASFDGNDLIELQRHWKEKLHR